MKQFAPFTQAGYPYTQAQNFMPRMPMYPGMPNPQMITQATAPKTGLSGLLQRFLPSVGSGNLTETLGQLQNILKMTQSITPMIQQYGPLLKSLPSMLALMKEFNESDESDESKSDESNQNKDESKAIEDEEKETTDDETEVHIDTVDHNTIESDLAKISINEKDDNLYKIETLRDRSAKNTTSPILYI
ncbi:VrrA/YqfQ family protein [Amphibacillus sediminis]|uniref:VrrA/YqfQ family protein n=1 Tax=Amphibacillus sediminis TaxID=360185 RepID=UPI000831E3A8|nr:VrrA/YqfQ family protein [Amphibacillus sediminis]